MMNREAQVAAAKKAASDAIHAESITKKAAYDTEKIEAKMLEGMDREQAEQQVIKPGALLDANFEINFYQLRVSAALTAISKAPSRFDNQPCNDPSDDTPRAIFYWNKGIKPCLFSQNDGGTKYFFSGGKKEPNHAPNVPNVPDDKQTAAAIAEIEQALKICRDQPGVLASPKFTDALGIIGSSPELLMEYRVKIKNAKPSGVLMASIDSALLPKSDYGGESGSVASELIALVESHCELIFDDKTDSAYVSTKIDGVTHTMKIGGSRFIDWLSFKHYSLTKMETGTGISASESAIKQAGFALSGIAKYDGLKQKVHLRVAAHKGGYILFIGDDRLRAIEILPTGWRILDKSPVKFQQPPAMQALPLPQAGGDLSQLWQFINVPKADRLLVVAWLLECFRPDTPFPVLSIFGPHGTIKSTTTDILKQLTDNNVVNLRAAPKSNEDIFVVAGCNWVNSFENISHLPAPMQDALCTIATGGGFASRTLFTNSEESIIEVKRPVIINSIPNVVTAQDLVDRSISIECPRIDTYIEESTIKQHWEAAKPAIFGSLLDLFVKTLELLPTVKLINPPRMADFTRLGEAMAQALGHSPGTFDALYKANRAENIAAALESSPVGVAVRDMVDNHYDDSRPIVFYGTAKALYEKLSNDSKHRSEGWPRSPKGLSDALKRQQPALLSLGIEIEHSTHREYTATGRGLTIKITKIGTSGTSGAEFERKMSPKKNFTPTPNDYDDDDAGNF